MNFPLWPEQASTFARDVDNIAFVLIGLTVFFTAAVSVALVFFSIRYRRGNAVDRSNPVHTSHTLEIAWSLPPLIIALGVFAWSVIPYASVYNPPKDADEIYVVGKRWMWHLQHADSGIRENNELHIPVGRAVKLTLISQDVIHGFYCPEFRVKRDAIPGLYNTCWFEPTKAGKYFLFCTEYCGTNHSQMGGWIYVMPPAEYEHWVREKGRVGGRAEIATTTPAHQGESLFRQYGCGNCHSVIDTARGPSLIGLYQKRRIMADGSTVVADRGYIRKAIISPENTLLRGYGSVTQMPSYKDLSEDDINQLIAYIQSLGGNATVAAATSATTTTPGRTQR
ncbi:MAG TPA: cytochrome c oxidase subunit II [Chthonomonadaceae bacterium]|nr:cytochrome c oxidase subunit II [Chthonomonadaceae bacterium]